jgi:hypothetical protein
LSVSERHPENRMLANSKMTGKNIKEWILAVFPRGSRGPDRYGSEMFS